LPFSGVGNCLVHAVEPLPRASPRLDVGSARIERDDPPSIGEEPREPLVVMAAIRLDFVQPKDFLY
jgi:hypothetical protein